MKESIYKTYDELPLFLNAETVAKVIPKEAFIRWVEEHTGGTA